MGNASDTRMQNHFYGGKNIVHNRFVFEVT
jgi:hypothetical protein